MAQHKLGNEILNGKSQLKREGSKKEGSFILINICLTIHHLKKSIELATRLQVAQKMH